MAIKFDWAKEIDTRLQSHGLSIVTIEQVLVKNAAIFNKVLKEVHSNWPKSPFMNLILSLEGHYSIKFLVKLLDAENTNKIMEDLKKTNPYGVYRKSFSYNRTDLTEAFSAVYDDAEITDGDEVMKEWSER